MYDAAPSPRPETPEPSSVQGHRNTGVQLLDEDGAISLQACSISWTLEACLKHIFSKYCVPQAEAAGNERRALVLLEPPRNAYMTAAGLDAWAQDTNGAPFSQETKDELIEFLDVTDDGELT
ncbi:hypothetical protein C0991_004229 [Blastosporella zonata]|nr:hypothetical protein C0991_004229 [Blastosporella zonata]